MIHLLTSRPGSAACGELLRQARRLGIPMRAGAEARYRAQDVVFAYGARRALLRRLADPGAAGGALVINGAAQGKDEQYRRLVAAGLPVPRWLRAAGLLDAGRLLELGGGPVIVKPDLGGFGVGVRLVSEPARFEARALRRPHVVQEFIACGGRCARVVVLGDAVAWAIDRVARDGVVAAYQHGRRGWLEPVALTPEEGELSVAAARALGIEIAGVDLIRTARGPFILEVNHRFVPYHLAAMYGDTPARIARYLEARHRERGGAPLADRPARGLPPRGLPRAIRSWHSGSRSAGSSTPQRVSYGRR
jgi:hypothetical protein